MALFAVLGTSSAMAQDVDIIWEEDFSSYSANDVPSGGDYNYVCVDGNSATKIYDEKLAGGTAPELLIGKKQNNKQGSFSVTLSNVETGDLTLQFKANFKNNNSTLEITADGATIGDQTVVGTDVTVPVTVTAGTVTITFKTTTTTNVRFDDVKLFKGVGKKPAGISWGKATASVTYGNPDDTYKYLPTFSNPNELDVTFESSNSEAVSISTDGEITVEGPGVATLTASFAGNDEYEEASVTCTVTVNKPQAQIDNTPETAYTVGEVLDILSEMDNNNKSVAVYTKGTVKSVTEVSVANGNATFVITDGTNDIDVFRVKYLEEKGFTAENQINVDDEVIIYGQLVNYLSSSAEPGTAPTPEIAQGGYIYSLNGETQSQEADPEDAIEGGTSADDALTVDQALAYINAFPDAGFTTTKQYYVVGTVSSDPDINTTNGNATFTMSGTDGSLTVFRVKGLEDKKITAEGYVENGDDVIILAKLQKYVKDDTTTPELSSGYIYSLNGRTTDEDPTAKGTKTNPYTVEEVQAFDPNETASFPTDKVWVKGYIAGCVNTGNGSELSTEDPVASNIGLSSTGVVTSVIPVQLPNGAVRTALNIVDNADNVGKEVLVYGNIQKYCQVAGVKNVTEYEFTGNSTEIDTGIQNLTIDADVNAPMYNLKGERVDANYRGVVIKAGKKTIQK